MKYHVETSVNIRWRVVADQIDSFSPDHAPHVHVVTHVDGTADTIAGCPNQLKMTHTHTHVRAHTHTHTHTHKVKHVVYFLAFEAQTLTQSDNNLRLLLPG